MDAQVQILQVSVRNTRTGKQVYDVACSDGKKRQVWEPGLATQLNSYAGTGQVVTIRFDVKQNGQYVNESIQAFAPPGQTLPPDGNMQPALMPGAPLPNVAAAPLAAVPLGGNVAPIQAAPQGGSDRFPPEVTTRITKLASYEYAATVVGGLFAGAGPEAEQQAVEVLDRIAKHVYEHSRSHENTAPTQAPQGMIVPTATTPGEVAAQLPPGAVQVGAPVAAAQDAAAEAPDVIQWD